MPALNTTITGSSYCRELIDGLERSNAHVNTGIEPPVPPGGWTPRNLLGDQGLDCWKQSKGIAHAHDRWSAFWSLAEHHGLISLAVFFAGFDAWLAQPSMPAPRHHACFKSLLTLLGRGATWQRRNGGIEDATAISAHPTPVGLLGEEGLKCWQRVSQGQFTPDARWSALKKCLADSGLTDGTLGAPAVIGITNADPPPPLGISLGQFIAELDALVL